MQLVEAQLKTLEKEKSKRFTAKEKSPAMKKATRLEQLEEIGPDSALLLTTAVDVKVVVA